MDPNWGVHITVKFLCWDSKNTSRGKRKKKSKEPLEHGVTLIRLQTGVEAKAGLCLISRAPTAGV